MAAFRKVLTEVKENLYERVDNDAKSYRFEEEEEEVVRHKLKYLNRHLRDEKENGKNERDSIPIYGYIGIGHIKLNDYEKAKENFDIQLKMAIEHKDEAMQRMAYANLGVIYKHEWKLREAFQCYEKSLNFALKHANEAAQGRLYNNMANILELQMDFERAIEFHNRHLQIATELNNRDAIVKSCGAIASLYHTIGDIPDAIRFLEQLMDQLRHNVRILDCLADDKSDSDDGGYINIEEENEEEGEKVNVSDGKNKNKMLTLAKLKDKVKKKK